MSTSPDEPRIPLDRVLPTIDRLLALSPSDIPTALNQATDVLVPVFRADKMDVFFLEAASQTLVALGTSDTEMGRLQHKLGLNRQPLANGGRSAQVFRTGRPFLDGHVERDEDELEGIRKALGVRSQVLAPIDVAGERRGVLSAQSAQPEHYGEVDLQFLAVVARWIGLITHQVGLVEQIARQAHLEGRRQEAEELVNRLTRREQEVAALVALGLSNAQIAQRLTITEGTAANHIRSILEKLGVPSRARIAAIMAQYGIVWPHEEPSGH